VQDATHNTVELLRVIPLRVTNVDHHCLLIWQTHEPPRLRKPFAILDSGVPTNAGFREFFEIELARECPLARPLLSAATIYYVQATPTY
jgi:hypothetical protein